MKKPILLLIFLAFGTYSLSISQKYEGHKYYMIQFRYCDQTNNTPIPFFIKLSVQLNDSVLNSSNSDFDGFVNLLFNSSLENTESLFLEISYPHNKNEDMYGDQIIIPFSKIELLRPINIDQKISISLVKFAERDEYEYNKLKSQRIPDRKETKAVDVN